MKYLVILYFIITSLILTGQDIRFPHKSYSVNNGFITDNIYSVFKDSRGIMWYGTDNGVLRYDGTDFKSFTTQDGLPDNEIFNFCEDYYGRIWFASFNGRMGYYFQGQFFNSSNAPNLKDDNQLAFISLIENQVDSSLLILYSESTVINEVYKDKIIKKEFRYNSKYGTLQYIVKEAKSKYIAYTEFAKLYFNDTSLERVDTTKKMIGMYYSKKIFSKRMDSLFILEKGDLKFYRIVQKHSGSTNNYFVDDNNYLFESTRGGILIYDPKVKDPIIRLLPDCLISSVNTDIEGNYWASTLNRGIYFFPKGFYQSDYYNYSNIERINAIQAKNGNVFMFTDSNRIFKLNSDLSPKYFYRIGNDQSILSRPVKQPIDLDNNHLFIGGSELMYSPIHKPDFRNFSGVDLRYIYSKEIVSLNDYIYWNGRSKMYKFNISNMDGLLHSFIPGDKQRIFDITFNVDKIWISTLKTVYYHENDSLIPCKSFDNFSFKKFNFYHGKMVGITHDYELVVGHSEGRNNQFRIQDIKENCSWIDMNYIFNHHVLLRSDKGYFILNLESDSAYLTPSENVLLPDFPQDITCDSPYVYFLSTDNAISRIDNSTILSVPKPPKIIVTSFIANLKYYNYESLILLDKSEADNIQIDFTGIGFNRKKINYQYSVNNKEWIDVAKNRINLINPAAGTYKIRIRCRSDSSEFSEPVQVEFVIDPPWYNTLFFWLAIVLLTIGSTIFFGFIIWKRKLRLEKLKHDNEIKFIQSEFKSLNALMNPHFIFNSLNNIQYLINDDKKLSANQYLGIFSKLIRQNMENINSDLISLEKEMFLVENYLLLEKLRFEDKFNFEIHVQEDLDISTIKVPPLLIQPLVENAIKHGIIPNVKSQGLLKISIGKLRNSIIISVEDDGVGINTVNDQAGLNYSLDNIRKRFIQLEKIHSISFRLTLEKIIGADDKVRGTKALIVIENLEQVGRMTSN